MAIHEGRCKNCGSIIRVDDQKDDAVCMFCWAHTEPSEAMRIASNPEQYEFPNEEQPEPDSSAMQAAFANNSGARVVAAAQKSKPAIKKKKDGKLSPAEKVALAKKEIVNPVASRKDRLVMGLSLLALLVIIVAISVPLALSRNQHRDLMNAEIDKIYTVSKLEPKQFSFEGQKNQQLRLVVYDKMDEATASEIMKNFKEQRAKIYGLSPADPQKNVRLDIYSTDDLIRLKG